MTVIRESKKIFSSPFDKIFAQLQKILRNGQKGYSYADASISSDQRTIYTKIKPNTWPLMLSTKLKIVIEENATGCSVMASTKSQRLIFGDVFNFYNRYLNDLMKSLEIKLM